MADKVKKPEEKKETPPEGQGDLPPVGPDGNPPVDEYAGTPLEGKSAKEIAALFAMSTQVTGKQQKELKELRDTVVKIQSAPPAAPPEPKTEKDIFADPQGAMADLKAGLEKAMEAQIAPLKQELSEARSHFQATEVNERMAQKYDDWYDVKPYIDNLIAQQNFPDPNDEGLLESLYYTAIGIMAKQGITPGKAAPKPKEKEGDPMSTTPMIPQHRSSPPPPAPKAPGKVEGVTWEDLDATETVLCKASGMQPAEFKYYQDMDERDVATAEPFKVNEA